MFDRLREDICCVKKDPAARSAIEVLLYIRSQGYSRPPQGYWFITEECSLSPDGSQRGRKTGIEIHPQPKSVKVFIDPAAVCLGNNRNRRRCNSISGCDPWWNGQGYGKASSHHRQQCYDWCRCQGIGSHKDWG